MPAALARHDALLSTAITRRGGVLVKSRGEGDSLFAVFARATDALAAVLTAQRALSNETSPLPCPLRVRMALHTGEADLHTGDYYGTAVNRCARLRAIAHGGQVLLSATTFPLVRDALPAEVTLRDLGEHRLKDLTRPEQVFQLVAPDLPADFPPLRALDAHRHNLPMQATPLIGREDEVARVRQRLQNGARLLTLSGPGGTGKTRLALQVGAELLEAFADGVRFVPLAPISDAALVVPAIAQMLGVTEVSGQALMERLQAQLRGQHLLLILDNFEQVTAAAPAIADLLTACSGLSVLVTSRAVLHVYGEQEYPVPPLALPPRAINPPPPGKRHDSTLTATLSQYPAVALFIQRAQAVKPDFTLTNETAPAVAEICYRLDGLPLALELAAARIRILTPEELLRRLEHRLTVLTGGARNLPAHQQTLRDTIAWSYDLLTPAEQALFRRLAVFVGGCTLAAVEWVCAANSDVDVLDGGAALVEQSLLRQEDGAGTTRFVMLETIREFAREQLLASAEAGAVRDAHLAFVHELVTRGEREFEGVARRAWLTSLDSEHDNIRAALDWSLADLRRAETGLAITVGLYWFWHLRSHHVEARHWLARLLASAPTAPPVLRARALANAGAHAFFQSDLAAAQSLLEEGTALSRANGERWALAWALQWLGPVIALSGDPLAGRMLVDESVMLFRDLRDDWHLGGALFWLGRVAAQMDDDETARAAHRESTALLERSGDRWTCAPSYGRLGHLAHRDGDYATAGALLEECVVRMRENDDRPGLAIMLDLLGEVRRMQGDRDGAVALFQESIRLAREIGRMQHIALGLVRLAAVAAQDGDHELAARFCGAAEAMAESARASIPRVERAEYSRTVTAVRARLGDPVLATAWAAGQAMPLEKAIAEALETD
jgi:predicted ATPase